MAEESRMNLAALQQRDPYITEIIDKAVKVALYKFSQKQNKWSVTDIEGSLFVYRRSASPSYGLMILNRKDLNNLVQPLTSQVEFHLNTPFLLFKKLSDDLEDAILGIWFVDTGECIRLTEKIQ
ncbi:mRNA-decapping enzyme 1A, partial [Biomphalaria pfeifferi]